MILTKIRLLLIGTPPPPWRSIGIIYLGENLQEHLGAQWVRGKIFNTLHLAMRSCSMACSDMYDPLTLRPKARLDVTMPGCEFRQLISGFITGEVKCAATIITGTGAPISEFLAREFCSLRRYAQHRIARVSEHSVYPNRRRVEIANI